MVVTRANIPRNFFNVWSSREKTRTSRSISMTDLAWREISRRCFRRQTRTFLALRRKLRLGFAINSTDGHCLSFSKNKNALVIDYSNIEKSYRWTVREGEVWKKLAQQRGLPRQNFTVYRDSSPRYGVPSLQPLPYQTHRRQFDCPIN